MVLEKKIIWLVLILSSVILHAFSLDGAKHGLECRT